MPANRSRTLEWRRCLSQIRDRSGAIEIAVARSADDEPGGDLVWRVRVLDLTHDEVIVEQPVTIGQAIELQTGLQMKAFLTVGQNRWAFMSKVLGTAELQSSVGHGRSTATVRLALPDSVVRCQRRSHERMSTATLTLPDVEMWPLLDPSSVVLAERALELRLSSAGASSCPPADSEATMPDVGPRFSATLVNIGGGGVGIIVSPESAQVLAHHSMFWLRLTLPGLAVPICAMGKIVHTHIESTQETYAGIAFDFSFNPAHQRVVVDQICRYIASQQRRQLRQSA